MKAKSVKNWRAKDGDVYYSVSVLFDVCKQYDCRNDIANADYKEGNYFRTEEEARKNAEEREKEDAKKRGFKY